MKVMVGNAGDLDTQGSGWFIGYGDWTLNYLSGMLHVPKDQELAGLCVKWYDHPTGDDSGNGKPVSEGTSISIMISGGPFEIKFSEWPDFPSSMTRTVLLQQVGDFAAWGEGIFHRWRCVSRSTIMTIRWNIVSDHGGDQKRKLPLELAGKQ